MSAAGRTLQPGDEAITDYHGRNKLCRVVIVSRHEKQISQSGICFTVRPALNPYEKDALIDADWFQPAPPYQQPQELPMNTEVSGSR